MRKLYEVHPLRQQESRPRRIRPRAAAVSMQYVFQDVHTVLKLLFFCTNVHREAQPRQKKKERGLRARKRSKGTVTKNPCTCRYALISEIHFEETTTDIYFCENVLCAVESRRRKIVTEEREKTQSNSGAHQGAESQTKIWYRFWQPYGELDILIESWIGLGEYVRRLKPRMIQRIVRGAA